MRGILFTLFISICLGCASGGSNKDSNQLSFDDVRAKLSAGKWKLARLVERGPFKFYLKKDLILNISPSQTIRFDYAAPIGNEPGPLAIIHHGNKYVKEAHENQIRNLASWGIHAVAVQSKNQHNWIKNGYRLARFTKHIMDSPQILSSMVSTSNIIVIGHSFGGSAATIAASINPRIKGVILLDPAVVSDQVLRHQKRVKSKTILLGADPKVFLSRKRETFFKNISELAVELTIKGATHNDAQDPSITKVIWGNDPSTSEIQTRIFSTLITAGTMFLSGDGNLETFAKMISRMQKKKLISKVKSRKDLVISSSDSLEGYTSFIGYPDKKISFSKSFGSKIMSSVTSE